MSSSNSSDRSITLVIPGLFGFSEDQGLREDGSRPAVPALETYLARADRVPGFQGGFEAKAFALFGIDAPAEGDLPVAAVTRALDLGVIDKGWWLRADPVHLRPDRDRLILFDTQAVPLTQEEANELAAEVADAYVADGWLLKAPRPGRWYLKPPRAARILTTPLPQVIGKDIHPYLPQGKDGKAWHTILNEVQILLHTAAVNTRREERGVLPINSLWFWGGGRLPSIADVPWAQVHSEEPITLALARLSETPSSARPASFGDWQRQAHHAGAHLVVLDEVRAAAQYGESGAWATLIERLDRDWIAPLVEAVRSRALAEATLCTDAGTYRLTRAHARRWWRRRRPLGVYH